MLKKAAILVTLLLLPAALHAQQGGQGRGGMGMGGMGMGMGMGENVPEFIAGKAAELQLTEDQVARIQVIARRFAAQNDSIMGQLRAAMQGGGMREVGAAERERLMAERQKMMKLAEHAMHETDEILTTDQRTRAHRMVEEWRASRMPQRRGGGSR
jgi:hypothetical protein